MPDTTGRADLQDKPIGDLVKELSDQTSRLVRSEIELAKAELSEKGKQAGIGAGLFGGAGLFAVFGFGALTAAIIAILATAMDAWIAAAIVAVVYFAIAGIAGLMGKGRVRQATPPVPKQAIDTTKTDVEVTKARVKEARS
jgi:uncharacterized membrane protein YqjE